MIAFARKKLFRDERLLQMLFLLSILRGMPDDYFDNEDNILEPLYLDYSLGSLLGRSAGPATTFNDFPHQKSMDSVLGNYQHSIIADLHNLGRLSLANRPTEVHAYLLNAESAITEPPSPSSSMESPRNEEAEFATSSFSDDSGEIELSERFLRDLERISLEEDVIFERFPEDPFIGFQSQIIGDSSPVEDIDMDARLNRYTEDLQLLEAIWKQDVDLGVPRQVYDSEDEVEYENEKFTANDILAKQYTRDKEPEKEPGADSEVELTDDKPWHVMNFTIDSETGALLAANESDQLLLDPTYNFNSPPTLHLNQDDSNFNVEYNLNEALNIAEFSQDTTSETKTSEADSGYCENSSSDESSSPDIDAINASIDEMLQTSHLHNHRNVQGRLGGLVRNGSMEQRWQDLASLLSLPSPDAHHVQSPPTPSMASHGTSPIHTHSHLPQPVHHPHPLYANHEGPNGSGPQSGISRGILVNNANLPQQMSEHSAHNMPYSNSMGASSHLVASSMNLANNSDIPDHHYKMETSNMTSDMMYYQHQHHNSTSEINQSNDGMWPSILSEDELQLMDIGINDYNGRGNGEYPPNNYRYPPQEDPHRHPQKKHHLYGKRYFHDNPPTPGVSNLTQGNHTMGGPTVGVVPLGTGYPSHYQPAPSVAPIENTTIHPSELKYSCSMDFRTPEVTGNTNLDHVHHNHSYHLTTDGPSGLGRPIKDRKGRKHDSEKNLSRDEKKARSLSLPITCEDIINLPMDEFNERISKYDLSEAQLSLIRDIRRRGKNKVAAQNCRKRKLDQIVHLAEEVKVIQYRKNELRSQMDNLTSERARVKHKFSILYRHIFQSLRDAAGNPYSPHEFSLQQSADGSILLVPRSSTHHSMETMGKVRNTKEESSP